MLVFSESPEAIHECTRLNEAYPESSNKMVVPYQGDSHLERSADQSPLWRAAYLFHPQEESFSSARCSFRANRQLNNLSMHRTWALELSMIAHSAVLAPRRNG